MIAIDLQQTLDSDPKAIQEINFSGNLNRCQNFNGNTTMFFNVLQKLMRRF